jgi:hypothetical protein
MVLLPLQVFDHLTQINSPPTLFLIDGRDLLRVLDFRDLKSQTFSLMNFIQRIQSSGVFPPDLTIEDYFESSPGAHKFAPRVLRI